MDVQTWMLTAKMPIIDEIYRDTIMEVIIENITEPNKDGVEVPVKLNLDDKQTEAVVSAGITQILSEAIMSAGIPNLSLSDINKYIVVQDKIKEYAIWYVDKFDIGIVGPEVCYIRINEKTVEVLYNDQYTVDYSYCSFPVEYLFMTYDEVEKLKFEENIKAVEEKKLRTEREEREKQEKEFSEYLKLKSKYEK